MRRRLPKHDSIHQYIVLMCGNRIMISEQTTSEAASLQRETGGFAFIVSDMDGYLLLLSADYHLLARGISFRGAKDIKTRLVDGIQLMTLQIVDGLAI